MSHFVSYSFTHKSKRKNFVLYVLIDDKNILHDFMLWKFRDDFEFIIAMQYNFHMSHVNRANQFRNELTISRFEQINWTKRMIEYMMNSINTNAYIVWNHYQSQKNFNHRNRRVFIQKLIEKFIRSSNIIHQSSKSIYCVWNDCSINFHIRFRKRQTFIFRNVNIQYRSNRKTFDYCMTCKMNLCVSFECFKIYHDSKEMSYECFDQ